MNSQEMKVLESPTRRYHKADISRKEVRVPDPSVESSTPSLRTGLKTQELDTSTIHGESDDPRRHRHHRHRHRNREPRIVNYDTGHHRPRKRSNESSRVKAGGSQEASQSTAISEQFDSSFIEDRKGDQYNATYGSLHRYSIPRYRAAGYHRIVGLDRAYTIQSSSEGKSRIVGEDHTDFAARAKVKSLLVGRLGRESSPLPILSGQEIYQDSAIDQQRDFLSFDTHRSRKRRRLEGRESFDFRKRHGTPTLHQGQTEHDASHKAEDLTASDSEEHDSEASSVSAEDDSFDRFKKDVRQQRSIALSKAVHDQPENVEAWLALVSYQDELLLGDSNTTSKSLIPGKRGLLDIKISIYEAALSKNEDHVKRDRLINGLMEEGSKVWDAKKLSSQWRTVLKDNTNSFGLWVKYLAFQQSNFPTFTYEQCKGVYSECLQIASRHADDHTSDHIYVLLRLTTFAKDAGFIEFAIGLWQSVLEFNFFRPESVTSQTEKPAFEDFWNSEVARIGEEGAQGWRSASSLEMPVRSDISTLDIDPVHVFRTWSVCEQERMSRSKLPARTLDDVQEDDPYRVIISSDIITYLYCAPTSETRDSLLNAFLLFCNLPSLPVYGGYGERRWRRDAFVSKLEEGHVDQAISNLATGSVTARKAPISDFITDAAVMFSDPQDWFSCWQEVNSTYTSVDPHFRRLALLKLVDALPDNDQLAEFVIAFELLVDPKVARKYAKSLLKQRSSSLRLYNAFALVECRSGRLEAAERVWSTALSMSRSFAEVDQQNAVLLWRNWIWTLLDRRQPYRALMLLLSISEGEIDLDKLPLSPKPLNDALQSTSLLKARRHLQLSLSQSISLQQSELICCYADLLALLNYFASSHSISAALAVYSSTIDPSRPIFAPKSTTLELLHQSRARLLHLHAVTSPNGFRPTEITSALAESVRLFPSNTIFLTLYHHHTQRSLLTDRIRSVVPTLNAAQDDSATKDSVIPSVFNIWSEINRPSYAGSTSHSIRAAFEHAVEVGKAGAHSVGIWKWYLQWELKMSQTDKKLSRAQDVFYRGMRACPWAKEFYMLAFAEQRLRDVIGFDGLRKIYETMAEKGIRIRVDLRGCLGGTR